MREKTRCCYILLHLAECQNACVLQCLQKISSPPIWLPEVLSTEKDFAKSAGQEVKKVLFRRKKLPFSSSEKCYFRRNICGSFSGPILIWRFQIRDLNVNPRTSNSRSV